MKGLVERNGMFKVGYRLGNGSVQAEGGAERWREEEQVLVGGGAGF